MSAVIVQEATEDEAAVAYDPRRGLFVSWPAEIGWERGGFWPWCAPLGTCAVCRINTEALFDASTATHHMTNRSGNPAHALVCANDWEFYLRDETA